MLGKCSPPDLWSVRVDLGAFSPKGLEFTC